MPELSSGEVFERLLDAAGAGEAWAYAELYERFAQRVKAFATSRRAAEPDAVANDVMLRVFQNLSGFAGDETRFVSWVFTIARNRIIDAHRAEARRPPTVPDELDRPDEPTPSAEDGAFERLSHDRALELLDLLTVDQREVIALRTIADLSLDQVSAIVDKPITAVKALQRRGLQRLQREILDSEVSR